MSKKVRPLDRARRVKRSLALVMLLLVAGASGGSQAGTAESPFSATSAHGTGTFRVETGEAVLQAPPPTTPWILTAERVELTYVDDWRSQGVAHPLRPGDYLFSKAEHQFSTATYSEARVRLVGHGEPNATMVLLPHGVPLSLAASLPQGFTLTADPEDVLETSHFVGPDAVFAKRVAYEIALSSVLSGPSVRLLPPVATFELAGPARLYLWGASLDIEAGNTVDHYRTGHWQDESPAGLRATAHYAYAFLNLTGVRLSLDLHGARLHATRMHLGGSGSINYEGATGVVHSAQGPIEATNATLVTVAGQYDLSPAGNGLAVATRTAPTTVVGQGIAVRTAGGPLLWPWASAALVVAGGLAYVAPYYQGCCLRRRGRVARTSSARGLRTEGFSHWASRAETSGYRRVAAILAGRAARNSPLDGDAHMEYAIRLQRVGRWRKALGEHETASQLYGVTPEGGHSSLNAYHAAVACTRLGQVADGLYWLQHAVEGDPGWAAAAHRDPGLAPLRGEPDFQAIAGRLHPMR